MRRITIFSPGGISSFFKPCQMKFLRDLRYMGAEGGGFVIDKGVNTSVRLRRSTKRGVKVYINRKYAPDALTTKTVVNKLLNMANIEYDVEVKHEVSVPIGAGYGSSAAGALSTSKALSRLLNLDIGELDVAMIAHISEIECGTGLGTVAPLLVGGCVLQKGCGGPGISKIEKIPIKSEVRIVSIYFNSIFTKKVLSDSSKIERVTILGEKALFNINNHPSLEEFMKESKSFAMNLGLQTRRVIKAINEMEKAGAIGATQNMIGEAVHGVFREDEVDKAIKMLFNKFSGSKIFTAGIYLNGQT